MESFISTGLISSEWSSVFAVGIGGAIGFVLESSGFSSSRKVAGTFYGYDFTSLRVFLMAGITSLIGLLYMDFFGWIDFFSFHIPDTYIWPTILGSIFMGVGFVTSGFCPGTSILSAAIGKLDGQLGVADFPFLELGQRGQVLAAQRFFDPIEKSKRGCPEESSFLENKFTPVIASDGIALELLKKEFERHLCILRFFLLKLIQNTKTVQL